MKREFAETDEQLRSDYERKSARFSDLEGLEKKAQAKEKEAQAKEEEAGKHSEHSNVLN